MSTNYLDKEVNINDKTWRVAEKCWKYGTSGGIREWFYILNRERADGTYESFNLDENDLNLVLEEPTPSPKPEKKRVQLISSDK